MKKKSSSDQMERVSVRHIDNEKKNVDKRQKGWLHNVVDRRGDGETRRARMEKTKMRYRL